MSKHEPIILSYATPKPVNGFARMSVIVIVFVAIVVPGLSSSLIRGSAKRLICLLPIIPIAFLIFGPLWGEVVFRSTRWKELGLYPFLLTVAVVEIVSVMMALNDRKRALEGSGDSVR